MSETVTVRGKTYNVVSKQDNTCTGCDLYKVPGDEHCVEARAQRPKEMGCHRTIFVEQPQAQTTVPLHQPWAVHQSPAATDSKPTNPKDAIGITKLPMHLVSPIVKAYQAISHFLGNVKYGAWNYRGAGVRYSVYKAALERHVDAWWEGEENDPVDGTPHLANAQACLNILIEAKYTPSSIDDRPPSRAEALAKIKAEFEPLMQRIRERYADKDPKHFTNADKV